jgi:serine/threonine-protein kinase
VASRGFARRHREISDAIAAEDRVVSVQRAKISPRAGPALKRALWEAEDRRVALAAERSEVWVDAVETAMRAATLDPESRDALDLLASLWWERLLHAERHGPVEEVRIAQRRVRAADALRFAPRLDAASHLSLTSSVPARVEIVRYDTKTRAYGLERVGEWNTPLVRLALPPGSYLLILRAPGRSDTHYPVALGRLEHHAGHVTLFTSDEIGDGWIHVPSGPFRMGGDNKARQPLEACDQHVADFFVQRTCVRSRDWKMFLDALEPEVAARHVPGEGGLFGGFRSYWTITPNGAELPEGWDPDWPIMAVNMADVHAYAAWLSQSEGRTVRLPTEEEWEKAARGVDGRCHPWGDGFDATWCHMRESVSGAPRPARVASYPMDRSPYGVLDMAGGVREWTSSQLSDAQIVIRGGTWGDDADDCRVASRSGLQPDFRYSFVGFRLVADGPRPT